MADIDPNSIPFIPPTDIALVDTGTGKPKTAFHDWLTSLWSWMKASVVDLTTKITTLTDTVGDNTAAIEEEQIARADADNALAAQVTTVAASVDDATANGQIYFAAKAGPAGAAAAYGLYLTAGSSYAGFEALALSGGGSAIGMTADQFVFTDAGTMQAVFIYSSGVWVLNSAVVIRSGASGARQVITNENTKIYDASNVLRVAIGINI
jgi:hypothetical protein